MYVMKFTRGEDLHDGISYEMFLDKVNHHKRACLLYDPNHFVLQQLDYLEYIDLLPRKDKNVSRQRCRI